MKKRGMALALASVMALSLMACGGANAAKTSETEKASKEATIAAECLRIFIDALIVKPLLVSA